MTGTAGDWRLRWLLEIEGDLRRLGSLLRRAERGEVGRIRAMIGEMRAARGQVRALATASADAARLARAWDLSAELAEGLARRLHGASWTAAAVGVTPRVLRRAWDELRFRVLPHGGPSVQVGAERASGPAVGPVQSAVGPVAQAAAVPARRGQQRWVGRCRDVERTLRGLHCAARHGLLPRDLEPAHVYPYARRGGGYLAVSVVPAALASLWRLLRGCGLRLLGRLGTAVV
jgi:hypothetical protein